MTPFRIVFSGLLPFAAGYFMSYLLRAVNAVVAPDLVKDVGLSPAQLGLLTAAYLGAFALFQLPLGVLLDRYGPRRVQAGLLSLAALGCLAFAFAPGFIGLFTARALIGLGFSAGLMASYKSVRHLGSHRAPLARQHLHHGGGRHGRDRRHGANRVPGEPHRLAKHLRGLRRTDHAGGDLHPVGCPTQRHGGCARSLATQFAQMMAILKTPLFWRVAPLLGLTSGIQIGIQTLWAGPWFRDVMGLTREEVARHLLFMAVAFMVGILSAGVIADRLGRRGIGPMQVLLGFNIIYFIAQAIIVFRIEGLMFPAWLGVAAFGQVAVLAFPWFAAHIGKDLAGRSNATINFAMFVAAFSSQYLVGLIIGLFPATATGYSPEGYSWAIGIFLVLQLFAFLWYLLGSPHKERAA